MRKFKRRRWGVGLILLMSLAIVVFGVALFFGTEPFQRMSSSEASLEVERVSVPMISEAPQPISEQEEQQEEAAGEDKEEAAAAQQQRQQASTTRAENKPAIPVPKTNEMWLTIPKMDLYDNYVSNSNSLAALDQGAAKRTQTKFPWQEDANTYISAHRVGWPGTQSYYQFYDLPLLTFGDKVYLYDANGTLYTYEVTEIFEVSPSETWVTSQVAGRDMISLQTCIENYGDYWSMGPNWYVRYVVRADRVAVTPA